MLRGADNALALLGMQTPGSVAGVDYVGASRNPVHLNFGPQAAQMVASAQASSAGKMAQLQQLAMAAYVPQIKLGLGDASTKVKAGTTTNFSPEGSVPLRITQLTVPSSIAPFFAIAQFTVARLNLLAGSVPIPAEEFIPNARHAPLEMPILAAGSQIVVGAQNIDAADHLFLATVTAIDLTSSSARMIP